MSVPSRTTANERVTNLHRADPRVLVDTSLRDTLLGAMRTAGIDGAALVDTTRCVLVQSIHIGIALAGCAALCAALLVRRIAHIRFQRAAQPSNSAAA